MNTEGAEKDKTIVTRIFIQANGDIIVTDLWGEVQTWLKPHFADEGSSGGNDK